jgi:hypothetical protein
MSEREGGRPRRPPDLRPIVLVSSPIGYIRASASTRNPVRHRAARNGVKASLAGSSTKAIQSGPGIGCRRGNHRAAFGVAARDRLATAGNSRLLQILQAPRASLPGKAQLLRSGYAARTASRRSIGVCVQILLAPPASPFCRFVADSPLEGSGFELLVPQFSSCSAGPALLRRIGARLSKESNGFRLPPHSRQGHR